MLNQNEKKNPCDKILRKIWDTVKKIKSKYNTNNEKRRNPHQRSRKYFQLIIQENFPDIKKEIPINEQESHRILTRLHEKRNSTYT